MDFSINGAIIGKNIAGYDFDWTLVKPKNGRTFPKDVTDWVWYRKSVPEILKKNHTDGFSIVIFTTQTKLWKIDMIKQSLGSLGIPIHVVVGFGKNPDDIKKPDARLFYNIIKKFNKKSFFVGDAAGRSDDFSDSDLQFAKNVGLKFYTPEEVFPSDLVFKKDSKKYTIKKQEIIVMVGYPSSGKSTFVKTKLEEYHRLDGDILKSTPRMIKEAMKYIVNQKSVVFDSTNGKLKNRQMIYDFARTHGIPVRCFVVDTSIQDAMQLNDFRAISNNIKKIPKIAFYTYRKHYDPPTSSECNIVNISVLH